MTVVGPEEGTGKLGTALELGRMNVNESKVIVVGPEEGTGKLGTALVLPHAHPPTVTVTVLTGTGADEGRALLKRMEDDGQGAVPMLAMAEDDGKIVTVEGRAEEMKDEDATGSELKKLEEGLAEEMKEEDATGAELKNDDEATGSELKKDEDATGAELKKDEDATGTEVAKLEDATGSELKKKLDDATGSELKKKLDDATGSELKKLDDGTADEKTVVAPSPRLATLTGPAFTVHVTSARKRHESSKFNRKRLTSGRPRKTVGTYLELRRGRQRGEVQTNAS